MRNWHETVEQHGPLVWRVLSRLLSNSADVEDCFQATFVDVWKMDRREAIENWPAALRHVATRRALDALRQSIRSQGRLSGEDPQSLVDRRASAPYEAIESAELAERLRQAVGCLDDRQAEIFCLMSLEGMAYGEVAEQLGISVNYVGVLLRRARMELQKRFNDLHPTSRNRESRHELP